MKNILQFAVLLLLFCFLSCEKSNLGTVDVSKEVPQLSNASVTPDSIYVENLTPVGGQYQISATVGVNATVGSSVNQNVTATIIRPNSSTEFQQLRLASASGKVFTGQIQFAVSRAQAGKYRILFSSRTSEGLQSNTLELALKLARRNSPPQLSNLNAPTTAEIPNRPQDSVNVVFSVSASDSDGLADIQQVRLKLTPFTLADDGGLGPRFGFIDPTGVAVFRSSGDAVAGDGIFSITIPLLYSSSVESVRTDTYGFQAIDTFGDTSATILHQITLRRRR